MPDPNCLESAIADWRQKAQSAFDPATLDELENHLREAVERLAHPGLTEADAFHRAVSELGDPHAISTEFRKLNAPRWLPAQITHGLFIALLFLATWGMIYAALKRPWSVSGVVLTIHVFSVTLGYSAVLLLGIVGICYVCQRSCQDFSFRRTECAYRLSLLLARRAFWLTLIGTILGAVWAKREWGRYWDWDPKETGGLLVLLWLAAFTRIDYWRRTSRDAWVASTAVGAGIVTFAWFGANMISGAHAYGWPAGFRTLCAVEFALLLFFFIGLAPAGWLRLRKP